MATTTSITTTNAGTNVGEWIAAMMISLNLDSVTKKTGIKYKRVVKTFAHSGGLQDETCDFTDTGTTTIAERILTVKRLQKHIEYCKNDFYTDWEAESMGLGTMGENLPTNFENFMLQHHVAQVASELEPIVWEGTLGAGAFDGFMTLAAADGTVNDVGTPITLTAANIVAEIQRLIDACPEAVLSGAEAPIIYLGSSAIRFYKRSQQALGWSDLYNTSDIPLTIDGFQIVEAKGMAADKMLMTYPSNSWVGTGVDNEHDQVATKDMFEFDLSDNYRVKFNFSMACQHGIGADIAAYNA